MENNLTTGSVWNSVISFSLPYLLSYFLQTLYGMADLFIIGQFCGVESTTAVSIGSQVMHMITLMIVGLAMGSVVMIGRAVGASNKKQVARSIGNTITLFMTLAILITGILLVSVEPIIHIMSTPKQAVTGTESYLMICFLGIPFITAYNVISSIFRGMGDSKTPMYFIAIACVANICLDYLFIGGMGLGPAGAALGTTLAQTLSVIISFIVIMKQRAAFGISRSDLKPDRKTMKDILHIGIPVALQDGLIQVAFITITIFANLRGLHDAAAVGIVEKLIGLFFLVPSAMLQTVSALSAQNIGAGQHGRARTVMSYSIVITVLWGILIVLFMHFGSASVIGLFSDNGDVVTLGCQYMKGYVWDCMIAGIHFSFTGLFCAYGLAGLSFLHNVISIFFVRIPLSYFASVYFTETLFPMGIASPAGSLVSVFICISAYIWLRRQQKKGRYLAA